ncbi:MAG: LD-carboxypeptidase, partial [Clostridia bacterium]|nr:LD-carboxypeptidase [Clostridia bacterium]
AVNGVLVGKPMDERYYDDYKKILVDVIDDRYLPIVYNVNIGHATPRCIIPFGVNARVDAEEQVIYFG